MSIQMSGFHSSRRFRTTEKLWENILSALYESSHRVAYQNLDPVIRKRILRSHINGLHHSTINFPKLISKVRSPRSAIKTMEERKDELNWHIDVFLQNTPEHQNPTQDEIDQFIDDLQVHDFSVNQAFVRQFIVDLLNQKMFAENHSKRRSKNLEINDLLSRYSTGLHEFSDLIEDVIFDYGNTYRFLAPAEYPENRCENPKVVDTQSAGGSLSKSNNPSMAKIIHDALESEANPDSGRYEYSFSMRQLLIKKFKEIDNQPPFGKIDLGEFQTFIHRWQADHSIPGSPSSEIELTFNKLDQDGDGFVCEADLTKGTSDFKNILRLSEEGNCRTCTFDRHEDCLINSGGHLKILSKYRPTSCEMRIDVSSLQCGFNISLFSTLKDGNGFYIQNIEMSQEMKRQFRLQLKAKNVDEEIIDEIVKLEDVIPSEDIPINESGLNELRVDIRFDNDEQLQMKSSEEIWLRAGYQSKRQFSNSSKNQNNPYQLKYELVSRIIENIGEYCNPLRFRNIEDLFSEFNLSTNGDFSPWPLMYTRTDPDTVLQFKQIMGNAQYNKPFPHPIVEDDDADSGFSLVIDPMVFWR